MARLSDDLTYGFFPIVKYDKTPDGLMVYGRAAGPGLDLDGQGFNEDYLKTAVPNWYKWANVREQHQQIAAGVGKELIDNSDGSFDVKALVVDPVTIKKVETGVLKGFSPGIRNGRIRKSARYPNGEIYAGEMIELSLVDRPSDPNNAIMICKSAGGTLLLPTDAAGNELAFENEDVPIMWLTEDLHKSASATALDVLNGDLNEAGADETRDVVHQLADLMIAEGFMLKSADLAAGRYDVSNLRNAAEALLALTEPEEDYPGMKDDFAALAKSATINGNTEDLVKAAVADITKAYDAKLEALVREVETLRATPVGAGAPVVLPPQHKPQITKSASTGIDYASLAASTTDPVLKVEYTKLADREATKTS